MVTSASGGTYSVGLRAALRAVSHARRYELGQWWCCGNVTPFAFGSCLEPALFAAGAASFYEPAPKDHSAPNKIKPHLLRYTLACAYFA